MKAFAAQPYSLDLSSVPGIWWREEVALLILFSDLHMHAVAYVHVLPTPQNKCNFVLFYLLFNTGFLCIAPPVLELTM